MRHGGNDKAFTTKKHPAPEGRLSSCLRMKSRALSLEAIRDRQPGCIWCTAVQSLVSHLPICHSREITHVRIIVNKLLFHDQNLHWHAKLPVELPQN
ncbi:hypothetical protein AAFF_G00021600 [Aldrovandia affinis]|uniref:Uncharacterized protein n=1 Tax=Aldrovandia affinis TaxID=143900 RepID=A0AAD7WGG6_9TELE|nr:hypothetical protein AAFF_G00021600 [Aldrovandia affinis]